MEQTPPMHCAPVQHCALVVHTSPSPPHPLGALHTFWPFTSWHVPPQHSKPASHVLPFALHASSDHCASKFSSAGSCPGSQKAGWLGSIVPVATSTAATQTCW